MDKNIRETNSITGSIGLFAVRSGDTDNQGRTTTGTSSQAEHVRHADTSRLRDRGESAANAAAAVMMLAAAASASCSVESPTKTHDDSKESLLSSETLRLARPYDQRNSHDGSLEANGQDIARDSSVVAEADATSQLTRTSRSEMYQNDVEQQDGSTAGRLHKKRSFPHNVESKSDTKEGCISSSYDSGALFPMQLHCALSHPSIKAKLALEWLPQGKTWRVLRWEALDDILPTFFPECGKSIDVFLDMVEAWGFSRITDVSSRYADQGSYFHEYFQLDSPGLCQRMKLRRSASSAVDTNNPLKRCRTLSEGENSTAVTGDVLVLPRTKRLLTSSIVWNDSMDEDYSHAERARLLVRDAIVIGREGTTLSSRGGRVGRHIHRTTPGRAVQYPIIENKNSCQYDVSNNSSFESSVEEHENLPYRSAVPRGVRFSLLTGKREGSSFDSSSIDHPKEEFRFHDDDRRVYSSDYCRIGKMTDRNVHRGEYVSSGIRPTTVNHYEHSLRTPDRLSTQREGRSIEQRSPADQGRQHQTEAYKGSITPSVVITPSPSFRYSSLCSGRGGKSVGTPVRNRSSPQVKHDLAKFNVSRRGSFAKPVLTTQNRHSDDGAKLTLTFSSG